MSCLFVCLCLPQIPLMFVRLLFVFCLFVCFLRFFRAFLPFLLPFPSPRPTVCCVIFFVVFVPFSFLNQTHPSALRLSCVLVSPPLFFHSHSKKTYTNYPEVVVISVLSNQPSVPVKPVALCSYFVTTSVVWCVCCGVPCRAVPTTPVLCVQCPVSVGPPPLPVC